MATVSRNKWIISFILGGILLFLALTGESRHITYAADNSVTAAPVINFIYPHAVPAGSDDVTMVISGENFGTTETFIRVWVRDQNNDYSIAPINVIDTGIGLVITDTLVIAPNIYTIQVVKSNGQSIPAIPPDPIYDLVSNSVDFIVYAPQYMYLPIIQRK